MEEEPKTHMVVCANWQSKPMTKTNAETQAAVLNASNICQEPHCAHPIPEEG